MCGQPRLPQCPSPPAEDMSVIRVSVPGCEHSRPCVSQDMSVQGCDHAGYVCQGVNVIRVSVPGCEHSRACVSQDMSVQGCDRVGGVCQGVSVPGCECAKM